MQSKQFNFDPVAFVTSKLILHEKLFFYHSHDQDFFLPEIGERQPELLVVGKVVGGVGRI